MTSRSFAARAGTVRRICRISLGLVWFYEGLIPKLFFLRADQLDLVQRSGLVLGSPQLTLQVLGAAQVLFSLWLLSGLKERLAVTLATAGMAVLIFLVARGNPAMLTDPYGALVKDVCLLACAVAVWLLTPEKSSGTVLRETAPIGT